MVDIPEGVSVQVDGQTVIAKGPQGELRRTFPKLATLSSDGKTVDVSVKDKALSGTFESVISNMLTGVSQGYKKHLKVLYAHFPISVEVKGKDIMIKNFLGEKQPRRTALVGDTKVEAKAQKITVSGPDKEAVGQTAANLIRAVRIKKKDARIFQDGIYHSSEE